MSWMFTNDMWSGVQSDYVGYMSTRFLVGKSLVKLISQFLAGRSAADTVGSLDYYCTLVSWVERGESPFSPTFVTD